MKKLSIGLAILFSTLSTDSFAALLTGASSSIDVNVPCFNGGFTVGVEGLYLRPSTDQLDFAVTYPTTLFLDGTFHSVDPGYNWGWRADVGYIFPCSGNDIVLTYTDYSDKESNSVISPGNLIRGTFTVFAFGTDSPVFVFGQSRFKYQAADLDFGQHINVNCNWRTRWFGGLRYADLVFRFEEHLMSTTFDEGEGVADTVFVDAYSKSRFQGIGPRLGMDFAYHLYQGIGIVGHGAAALLVGNQKTKFSELDVSLFTGLLETENATFDNETRVVPNLDARLGLDYSVQFCNCQKSKLNIEVGYMVDHYFNSIDRIGESTLDEREDLIRHTIDTSFDGPYLRIQVNI